MKTAKERDSSSSCKGVLLYEWFGLMRPARNSAINFWDKGYTGGGAGGCCGGGGHRGGGGMAAMSKQVIALYIIASLCCVASMLPIVLCESGSQSTPLNYKPITSKTSACGNNSQQNCVTQRPPANEYQRPCSTSAHCRGGQKPTVSQSISKAQVSAATKQFGLQDHSVFHLALQWIVGWVLFLYFKL